MANKEELLTSLEKQIDESDLDQNAKDQLKKDLKGMSKSELQELHDSYGKITKSAENKPKPKSGRKAAKTDKEKTIKDVDFEISKDSVIDPRGKDAKIQIVTSKRPIRVRLAKKANGTGTVYDQKGKELIKLPPHPKIVDVLDDNGTCKIKE